jgi:hypothetical protein
VLALQAGELLPGLHLICQQQLVQAALVMHRALNLQQHGRETGRQVNRGR